MLPNGRSSAQWGPWRFRLPLRTSLRTFGAIDASRRKFGESTLSRHRICLRTGHSSQQLFEIDALGGNRSIPVRPALSCPFESELLPERHHGGIGFDDAYPDPITRAPRADSIFKFCVCRAPKASTLKGLGYEQQPQHGDRRPRIAAYDVGAANHFVAEEDSEYELVVVSLTVRQYRILALRIRKARWRPRHQFGEPGRA